MKNIAIRGNKPVTIIRVLLVHPSNKGKGQGAFYKQGGFLSQYKMVVKVADVTGKCRII